MLAQRVRVLCLVWAPLRATLDRELASLAAGDVEVVPATLGGDVGLHGAALVALREASETATDPAAATHRADDGARI